MRKDKGGKGMSVNEIERGLTEYIPRLTLQRRISEMQQMNWVIARGEAGATRYYFNDVPDTAAAGITEDGSIPAISTKVEHKPIKYQRGILEEYEPKKTNNLSNGDKENLAAIGKTTHQSNRWYLRQTDPSRFLADLDTYLL